MGDARSMYGGKIGREMRMLLRIKGNDDGRMGHDAGIEVALEGPQRIRFAVVLAGL